MWVGKIEKCHNDSEHVDPQLKAPKNADFSWRDLPTNARNNMTQVQKLFSPVVTRVFAVHQSGKQQLTALCWGSGIVHYHAGTSTLVYDTQHEALNSWDVRHNFHQPSNEAIQFRDNRAFKLIVPGFAFSTSEQLSIRPQLHCKIYFAGPRTGRQVYHVHGRTHLSCSWDEHELRLWLSTWCYFSHVSQPYKRSGQESAFLIIIKNSEWKQLPAFLSTPWSPTPHGSGNRWPHRVNSIQRLPSMSNNKKSCLPSGITDDLEIFFSAALLETIMYSVSVTADRDNGQDDFVDSVDQRSRQNIIALFFLQESQWAGGRWWRSNTSPTNSNLRLGRPQHSDSEESASAQHDNTEHVMNVCMIWGVDSRLRPVCR